MFKLRFLKSLLPFAVLLAATAGAQQGQGPGYIALSPAQATNSAPGKVEVVEVFSYGCIHCAQFQPFVDSWHKRPNTNKSVVDFKYVPATFNDLYKVLARGFYAAESMGAVANTHQKVFNALFVENKRVQKIDDLANLYASFGLNRGEFLKAANGFYVESQLRRADELMRAYRIDGTPTIVVAGKYKVTAESAGGQDKVFAVVDQLVMKERPAAAPAAAPKK
ncbi:MAG TPA: thiol:disulfide interchange protein DsbA/DsbL [Steroidobacteraceae bacterium]|nr:thiol:disulfide interchange protein DsbA/DsbL [Steroidobacteraceae bacterium]